MRRLGGSLSVAALVTLSACGTAGPPAGATQQGREISHLWEAFFWPAVAVAAVVYGLILWSVIRYRARSDEEPPQFRFNVPLEIVYTLIPVAIVATLFVLTYRTESEVGRVTPEPATRIHVRAFNWSWRFDYPGHGVSVAGTPDDPPQMVVPAGETVHIRLTASDVIHAFYVPDFLFKRDAIPGTPNEFDLKVEEPGVYRGRCAEYCGLDHARMLFSVRAVPAEEFRMWLEENRTGDGPGEAP